MEGKLVILGIVLAAVAATVRAHKRREKSREPHFVCIVLVNSHRVRMCFENTPRPHFNRI